MAKSFYKAIRSQEHLDLLKHPYEYTLLSLIAYRARRYSDLKIDDLEIGEAMIGDYQKVGLTRQQYRTALKNLEKWNFLTSKPTNRGSIVKLINSDVFDINIEEANQQTNQTPTNGQPTANQRPTTNNNNKNKEDKKEKNISPDVLIKFEKFWKIYPPRKGKKTGKDKTFSLFLKLSAKDQDQVLIAVENYAAADTGYSVDPYRFFTSTICPNGLWREWLSEMSQKTTTIDFHGQRML